MILINSENGLEKRLGWAKEFERTHRQQIQSNYKKCSSQMSQSVIQAVLVESKCHIPECYLVMGRHTSKVTTLKPNQIWYQDIRQFKMKLFEFRWGIELWSYQPQRLIDRWNVDANCLKVTNIYKIVQNQKWKVLLKFRSGFSKQNQTNSLQSKDSQTKSNSKGKTRLPKIKKLLSQKIIAYTTKPKPKLEQGLKVDPSYYTTTYSSFLNSKTNSRIKNYESCLDLCRVKKGENSYSEQAQNLYGFGGQSRLNCRPKQGQKEVKIF